jgi:hypothetical protein
MLRTLFECGTLVISTDLRLLIQEFKFHEFYVVEIIRHEVLRISIALIPYYIR